MLYGLIANIDVQADDHIELADDVLVHYISPQLIRPSDLKMVMTLWCLVNQSPSNRALLVKVHFPAAESLTVRYR
jgi:hypothetical protein